ncbi:unnamed protein product [Effrenium voratum]|uniref:GYF domain-containing protein n=1 Tax=Effrenium voratum TaxID=2562239 RepID=A0AA36J9G0_9DINO|nr:unnamed protein product [Effrenium voratum]
MAPKTKEKGGGKGKGKAKGNSDTAKRLQELDGHSVEAESNFEILRAQRAQARKGVKTFKDIRENEGVDEDDPLNSIDDGIRLEPFNMRREMREGHFDESGFYVLNKDEEKKVTDAWLDTVDQAERTATFRAAEKQNKALSTAANRISAMAKNLGPDSEGEEEEEDKEEGEEDKKEDKETEMKPEEAEAEDKEDEAKVIDILEELVAFLHPLETPAMALSRVRRGVEKKEVALKTRARMRQSKAGPAATTTVEREAKAKKRARFNEWGYEEPQDTPAAEVKEAEKTEEPAPEKTAEAPERTVPAEVESDKSKVESELAKAEALRAEAAAAVKAEQQKAQLEAQQAAQKSSVTSPEAVALAAQKAQQEDAAQAEAAKAFAAEMKMSRHVARALVPEGPEAAAMVNLNSEETREVREKAQPKVPEEQPFDGPARPAGKTTRRQQSEEEMEKRAKIDKITDLCNQLLAKSKSRTAKHDLRKLKVLKPEKRVKERGVLVYDSTRELLAIDVRQRKGEKLQEADAGSACAAAATPEKRPADAAVQYTNKRFKAAEGEPKAVVEAAASTPSAPSAPALLWQFRWGHNLQEVNGPFDSVTMQGWVTQGCFSEDRKAEVRQCNERNEAQERCWHPMEKIDFELYI